MIWNLIGSIGGKVLDIVDDVKVLHAKKSFVKSCIPTLAQFSIHPNRYDLAAFEV